VIAQLVVVVVSGVCGADICAAIRHSFTYIGSPNGPIQRTNPVRYVQYECYKKKCGVRNTKIGPRATRALPRLKNMVLKVVKMGT
jgi:hypothetical protein